MPELAPQKPMLASHPHHLQAGDPTTPGLGSCLPVKGPTPWAWPDSRAGSVLWPLQDPLLYCWEELAWTPPLVLVNIKHGEAVWKASDHYSLVVERYLAGDLAPPEGGDHCPWFIDAEAEPSHLLPGSNHAPCRTCSVQYGGHQTHMAVEHLACG